MIGRICRVLVLICVMGVLTALAGESEFYLKSVMPDKLLYMTGDPVKVSVEVMNDDGQERSGQLVVRLEWEMDEGIEILRKDIIVKPRDSATFEAEWESKEVLGAAVIATLSENGKIISQKEEYFNVVDADDALRVSMHASDSAAIPYEKSSVANRENYANVYEMWAWGGCPSNFDRPDRYLVHGYGWVTRENLIKKCNNPYGIKILAYSFSPTQDSDGELLYVRKPDWTFASERGYSAAIAVDMADNDINSRRPRPWQIWNGRCGFGSFPDYSRSEIVDWYLDGAIKAMKEIGFHGIRFDGHPQIFHVTRDHYRIDGSFLSPDEIKEANREALEQVISRLRKECPEILLYWNHEPVINTSELPGPDSTLAKITKDGGVVGSEVTRHATLPTNYYNRWADMYYLFRKGVDYSRAYGGYYSAIATPAWELKKPETTRMVYSMMFATGTQPWAADVKETPANHDFRKEVIKFLKMGTRYSAMFWGHGLTRQTDPEWISVTVPDDRELWWKETVQTRKSVGGKQLVIITFINPPPTEVNLGPDQPLPEPAENVKITFRPWEGKRVVKAWEISAHPDLERNELKIVKEGDSAVMVVPKIEIFKMVVVELQ